MTPPWRLLLSEYPEPILEDATVVSALAAIERAGIVSQDELAVVLAVDQRKAATLLLRLHRSKLVELRENLLYPTAKARGLLDRFGLSSLILDDVVKVESPEPKIATWIHALRSSLGKLRQKSYSRYTHSLCMARWASDALGSESRDFHNDAIDAVKIGTRVSAVLLWLNHSERDHLIASGQLVSSTAAGEQSLYDSLGGQGKSRFAVSYACVAAAAALAGVRQKPSQNVASRFQQISMHCGHELGRLTRFRIRSDMSAWYLKLLECYASPSEHPEANDDSASDSGREAVRAEESLSTVLDRAWRSSDFVDEPFGPDELLRAILCSRSIEEVALSLNCDVRSAAAQVSMVGGRCQELLDSREDMEAGRDETWPLLRAPALKSIRNRIPSPP